MNNKKTQKQLNNITLKKNKKTHKQINQNSKTTKNTKTN